MYARARAAPHASPGSGADMNFSYPFIRRPIGTTLLAIGLFLVGAVAYALPAGRQPADRRISRPSVSAPAAPAPIRAIMAATVAAPLERRLGEIPGVTEITSVSARSAPRASPSSST